MTVKPLDEERRRAAIRTIPQPSDLNVNGNIFGGWVLSQMDLAGADAASRLAGGPVATVAIEGMKFHRPIELGDVISIYADIERTGRTSVTVKLDVYAERGVERTLHQVTEGRYIFVAIDGEGRPTPLRNA
ncbi:MULTISPECIES: acyl-CoA thioesterase [Kordiimonas]|jgi:acyl-CoA thioesterase YciA|uniref:Acyl-CoA thioesterase YciA n=1 Tax=Kordiimonas lacus TaxID=637679 RepID=A0A1G7AVA7_9PROT|nr:MULTISPECIES: acyl-CoA thioesterase [Kordiimonas]SDE17935.1 acyl-CoA thioesterase YciA [Kordiimonas lacus]